MYTLYLGSPAMNSRNDLTDNFLSTCIFSLHLPEYEYSMKTEMNSL